jgi:dTDP-glucose pyrophosphorylase
MQVYDNLKSFQFFALSNNAPLGSWIISQLIQAHHHYVVGSRPALEITKRVTRLEAASDKVYQLLVHGRWFSPGTPASSTTDIKSFQFFALSNNAPLR